MNPRRKSRKRSNEKAVSAVDFGKVVQLFIIPPPLIGGALSDAFV